MESHRTLSWLQYYSVMTWRMEWREKTVQSWEGIVDTERTGIPPVLSGDVG